MSNVSYITKLLERSAQNAGAKLAMVLLMRTIALMKRSWSTMLAVDRTRSLPDKDRRF